MARLTLVYLAHRASGIASFRAFAESYRRHPAGIDHDLLVVYKGFAGPSDEHRRALDGLRHRDIEVPDRGFDIGSYREASRRLDTSYVCFVNSFSEILAPNWLGTLFEHAARPGVGVAGASGSWESFATNYEVDSRRSGGGPAGWARSAWRAWKLGRYRADYLSAPNPHLRSNAFLIERERWLSLVAAPLRSKPDLWRFESGRKSMSRQLWSAGQEVLVVGRDGVAYDRDRWPESATFRSGGQRNLLVADNRTREFEQADEATRRRLAQLAWGDRQGPAPKREVDSATGRLPSDG
jgi:hypothetical protein